MQVQPYLFFYGRCEEAIAFYQKALGAEVIEMLRFKDSPEPPPIGAVPPEFDNKVMHASFRIGESTVMASDGCDTENSSPQGFSLTLSVPDGTRAEQLFAVLADGGRVEMPMAKTFFSSHFGMVTDRFGVNWMVIVAQ